MFCQNCGTRLADDAKFCINCGAQVCVSAEPQEPLKPEPTDERPENIPVIQPPINQPSSKTDFVMLFTIISTAIMLLSMIALPWFEYGEKGTTGDIGSFQTFGTLNLFVIPIVTAAFCIMKMNRSFLFSSVAMIIGLLGMYFGESAFWQRFVYTYYQEFGTMEKGGVSIKVGYVLCIAAAIAIMVIAILAVKKEKSESGTENKPAKTGKTGLMILGILFSISSP